MGNKRSSPSEDTPPAPVALRERVGEVLFAQRVEREQVDQNFIRNGSGKRSPFEFLSKSHGLIRAGLVACGLSEWGKRNARSILIEEHTVVLKELPRVFDGLRLLHIADMHFECSPAITDALVDAVQQVQADVTVCTGDFRFATVGPVDACMRDMRQVVPHLPEPVWSVLGNHDALAMVPELEAMGVQVLMNEAASITRGEHRLWLAGIDDPHHYETDDLAATLEPVAPGDAVILLAHASERYKEAAAAGVALYLCGHTHGGQVCLPGGRAVFNHADAPWDFVSGSWSHEEMQGYTSRGSGCTGLEVRFNCPPEITVHTLRCGATD